MLRALFTQEASYILLSFSPLFVFTDSYMPGKFWVGASDLITETEWLWLPSQTLISTFTDWASKEPDNAGGNQHCMALDMHDHMKWRDENCEEKRNYICQAEKGEGGLQVVG